MVTVQRIDLKLIVPEHRVGIKAGALGLANRLDVRNQLNHYLELPIFVQQVLIKRCLAVSGENHGNDAFTLWRNGNAISTSITGVRSRITGSSPT